MNQKYRQTASSKVEKDFYKLLNNSNFGIDCRSNINNCYLEPIYDDFNEIGYDESLRDFFLPDLLRAEVEQTFNSKVFALDKNDQTYEARLKYLERKKEENLDSITSFEKNKNVKKRRFQTVDEKVSSCSVAVDPRKTKAFIELDEAESASVKSFAVKKKMS